MSATIHTSSWSVVRKTQVLATTAGFFVTIIVNLPVWPTSSGALAHFGFRVWVWLTAPAVLFMRAAGIPEGYWWALLIELAVNMILCFILGTLLGLSLKLWRGQTKNHAGGS